MSDSNPYLEPENYYDGYRDSIEKMKHHPEYVEFDKLCHMLFNTSDGKEFIKEIDKRCLLPALCTPMAPNYKELVIYMDGFKEAFRMIKNAINSHEQRIKAESEPK